MEQNGGIFNGLHDSFDLTSSVNVLKCFDRRATGVNLSQNIRQRENVLVLFLPDSEKKFIVIQKFIK